MKILPAWLWSLVRGRRGWALLLAAIIVLAIALIYETSRGSNAWYRLYTSNRLMAAMRDHPSNDPQAMDAWTVLWQRYSDGNLSAVASSRLIDQCLLAQAGGPGAQVGGEIEFLADCCDKNQMSPPQQATFLRQLVELDLRVRPRVSLGDDVPFEIVSAANLLGTYQFRLSNVTVASGDQVLASWPELLKTNSHHVSAAGHFPCPGPGSHKVRLRATGEIWKPGMDEDGSAGYVRCHGWPVSLTGEFEALPATPDGGITVVNDSTLKDRLLEQIQPKEMRYAMARPDTEAASIDGQLTGTLDVGSLPVGVAFEVVARARGKEYPLGTLCRARGHEHLELPLSAAYTGPRMFAVDIILRANPSLARQTVDVTEAWQGELVFRNIRVRIPGPETPPDPRDWD